MSRARIYIGKPPQEYDQQWFARAFGDIEKYAERASLPVPETFSITNGTAVTTLDASTATTAQVCGFLQSLMTALKNKGELRFTSS